MEGAGRVEDTINLIGHAARKVVRCIAELLDREFEELCREAGILLLLEKSVKRALDRDWSDPKQKAEAVDVLARQVLSLERWIEAHLASEAGYPPLDRLLTTLRRIMDQDLEPDPNGGGARIAQKVAKDRRISVEDAEMRHGRKSNSKRIDGYKRHVAADLDSQAIVACAVTPANVPEHTALLVIKNDLDRQDVRCSEAHFDRGYMGSPTVDELKKEGAEILCKPWKARNGELFTKEDFHLDLRSKTITCPAGHTEPIEFGRAVEFDPWCCFKCPLAKQCTTADLGRGRTVSIGEDERLQKRLHKMSTTKRGASDSASAFRSSIGSPTSASARGDERATSELGRTCTIYDGPPLSRTWRRCSARPRNEDRFKLIGALVPRIGSPFRVSSEELFREHADCPQGVVVVFLGVFAMQVVELRTMMAWTSATYVLVPLAARLVLRDPLTTRTLIGTVVVTFGMGVFFL